MKKVMLWPIASLLLAAALLWGVEALLRPTREARAEAAEQQWLETLLPGGAPFTAQGGDGGAVTELWRGSGGAVAEVVYDGYVAPVRVWVAVEEDGTVAGVLVRESRETPGLGERVRNDITFLRQFLGKRGNSVVGNDIVPVTGATVTCRTVASCVNGAVAAVTGWDVPTEATP